MDWAIQRKEGGDFLVVNTGSNSWNYQVKELAEAVQKMFSDVEVSINTQAQPDKRSYKVNFDLYRKLAPAHQPQVSLTDAVRDLKEGLERIHFADANFRQSGLIRLKTIQHLLDSNIIDENLAVKK